MVSIELTKKIYWDNNVEGYVILLTEDFESSADISFIEKFYPHVLSILKKHKFKGKVGQSFTLTALKNEKLSQFVFIGVGMWDRVWHQELEDLRRAVGAAVLKLKSLEVESAVIQVPEHNVFGVEQPELVKQMAIAAFMSDYKFTTFKSEEKGKDWSGRLLLATDVRNDAGREAALEQAKIVAKAINHTRHLADMPPNIATPTYVSEQAKKIAGGVQGLKCAVFGRELAEEFGMGGFLTVDVGSEQEGKFVVLEYEPEQKDAPTIAIVGKGVTFDSGGISLKPASYMTGMKFDMSGAAAVMGTMQAIAQLKPSVRVVGLMPLVENMPSGRAGKQDDVITFMNGKTAEIVNTDAEGRLILADALCYAQKFYDPDILIDVATLTGSCLHALGHSYTALLTKDEKLSELLRVSGDMTGDRVWPLPFDDDFKDAIKSSVADMSNSGTPTYKAGTITAAFFLNNFVEKGVSWAHLDIAGTADGVPGVNYLGKGATGVGVRLLVDFVMKYKR
ncbi:leucyl aminopeptidase [Candidatus Dependentiae bacterium]|nr:leucyl aminopeptidase [Candidatus Dependentiae bacterium]